MTIAHAWIRVTITELCHKVYVTDDYKDKSVGRAVKSSRITSLFERTELIMIWSDFWAINPDFGSLAQCFVVLQFSNDIDWFQ